MKNKKILLMLFLLATCFGVSACTSQSKTNGKKSEVVDIKDEESFGDDALEEVETKQEEIVEDKDMYVEEEIQEDETVDDSLDTEISVELPDDEF